MVCHVSPDGMAVQTPDDRNAVSSTASWAAGLCVSTACGQGLSRFSGFGGGCPSSRGCACTGECSVDKAGLSSGPRPGHPPCPLSPGCTLGPGTCPPWTLGVFTALDPGGGPRAPPCLPLGSWLFLRIRSLRASSTLQGCTGYILKVPGWAP